MTTKFTVSAVLGVALAGTVGAADAQGLRPVGDNRFDLGFVGLLAQPTGEFADYVGLGGGVGAHAVWTPGGVLGLRADASYLIYGSETRRYQLVPLVDVDVTTRNQIAAFHLGPQLTLGGDAAQVYGFAELGFSYFFTSSDVSGSGNIEPFANTTNFDDFTFATGAGGGVRLAVARGRVPVSLDLGARYLYNGRVSYLREGSVTIQGGTVYYAPIRSQTNLVLYHFGVTIGLGR
jgi:hypothetical protein